MNRCLEEADIPEWMNKGKTTLIQKKPPKRNRPKQLYTRNVPNYYLENTNITNKRGDLLSANKLQVVSRGIERMPQVDQRYRGATID